MAAVKAVRLLILCHVVLALSAVATANIPRPCLDKIKCDGEFCVPVKDKNGCYYCACPELTCATVDCAPGYYCVMKQTRQCITTPCFPTPVCDPIKECPKFKCLPICKPGVGPDGCPKCDCPKTCELVKCPPDQTCVMNRVNCRKEPCDLQPSCVPKSPRKKCHGTVPCKKPCVADIGPDGCLSICSCPKTCKDIRCEMDEVCELVEVQCFRAPCFPVPTCFPKDKTCSERPNTNRCFKDRFSVQWTYNSSVNSCQWFPYYGCSPSPNTFSGRRQCTDTCVPDCPVPMCMDNCYLDRNIPGACPKCDCPCLTVRCKAGYECRLRNGDCSDAGPCLPVAYCAPTKIKCPPFVCRMACPRGYEQDKKGCIICKCIE